MISDIHIPFHDKEALTIALEFGADMDVDSIYMNGDVLDAYQISKWLRDPRQKAFKEELDICRGLFESLRDNFGEKVKIYYKFGNHEQRYDLYMKSKAPELYGIIDFELPTILTQLGF